MKPLTVSLLAQGSQISKLYFPAIPAPNTACSLDSHLSHLHIFPQNLTPAGAVRSLLPDLNLEFPLSKPKNWELDCGKVCFVTMRNVGICFRWKQLVFAKRLGT